jgi:radical SAM superfamily enzyme YgiQ (UPF0313 family)
MLSDYTVLNCIGLQSFCAEALKKMGRPTINMNKFNKYMEMVKRFNIVLKLDIILGLPFESFENYFEGLELLLSYLQNTDHILNIHRLQILPGSELETLCNAYEIVYSKEAPYYVLSTNSLSKNELNYASKLSAILFRIINSPLRWLFYEIKKSTGKKYLDVLENIYHRIISSKEFSNSSFISKNIIEDKYWGNDIFMDISSQQLIAVLNGFRVDKACSTKT